MKRFLTYHRVAFFLGIVTGILWFRIGEVLDNSVGNTIAWYVLPAMPPCIVAVGFAAVTRQVRKSVALVAIWYIAHWLPMYAFIGFVTLCGGM